MREYGRKITCVDLWLRYKNVIRLQGYVIRLNYTHIYNFGDKGVTAFDIGPVKLLPKCFDLTKIARESRTTKAKR